MKDAFIANQVRGLHSSGLFQVKQNNTIHTFKKAMSASEFLNETGARDLVRAADYARLTVGHVRHATAGKINDDNAHPFLVEREDGSKLVGVHNGTLKNWKHKKGSKEIDVDSAWAFQMLADEGHDAFEYFDGAFALVWYDSRHPESFFMARNAERPLHYMITEDGKTMLGASELGMLGWIAERNKFKVGLDADKRQRMHFLQPGKIYKFSLEHMGQFEEWDAPKYDAATGEPPVVSNFPQRSSAFFEDWPDDWDGYGYTENGVRVPYRQQSNYSPYRQSPGNARDAMELVKKALGEARDRRIGFVPTSRIDEADPDELITNEVIENNLTKAIKEFNEARSGKARPYADLASGRLFLSAPNSGSATPTEMHAAQEMKIYGQVVAYDGILHDDELSEHAGQFEFMEEDGSIREVEAIVRFVTTKEASKYEQKDAVMMTVVGFNSHGNYGYPVCILAPLSVIDMEEVDRKRRHLRSAAH